MILHHWDSAKRVINEFRRFSDVSSGQLNIDPFDKKPVGGKGFS